MGAIAMKPNRNTSMLNPLNFSIAALALIVIFLVIMTPSLYRSGSTIMLGSPEPNDSMDKLLARHQSNMETDVDRFNGRSFFYTPDIKRKPPPPPPPPPPKTEEEEAPPPPPPPPRFPPNYTGPKLVAILGDEAWFKEKASDGDPLTRLTIGEPHEDINVVSTNPPRGITVNYQGGGPYEVALIDMDSSPFADMPSSIKMPDGVLEDVVEDHHEHMGEPCPPKLEGVDTPFDDTQPANEATTPDSGTVAPDEAEPGLEAPPLEPAGDAGTEVDHGTPVTPETKSAPRPVSDETGGVK